VCAYTFLSSSSACSACFSRKCSACHRHAHLCQHSGTQCRAFQQSKHAHAPPRIYLLLPLFRALGLQEGALRALCPDAGASLRALRSAPRQQFAVSRCWQLTRRYLSSRDGQSCRLCAPWARSCRPQAAGQHSQKSCDSRPEKRSQVTSPRFPTQPCDCAVSTLRLARSQREEALVHVASTCNLSQTDTLRRWTMLNAKSVHS
jgi:hypothetical protein